MAVISVLNPKGGSGKTTLTTNLAQALHLRGNKVLIVDSDPQGSARDWHAASEANPLPLVSLDRANNIKTLSSMTESYDHIVLDGAAKLEDIIAAAIKASDFILIPVQPSPYDIWAASDLVDFIKARQEVTDGSPQAAFVITRHIEGTRLGDDVRKALDEYELPVFRTAITQRQIYPQTASEGRTVLDGDNAKARDEINALADELIAMMPDTGRGEK
ncbi:peptide transporter [Novosphingobium marinum]|uniref:Chromosome partitioning protein n=1 Tax=Novosphingobium marinum TaxID=1514948 RepID=A0A7Y9Y1Z4_9SPHN|nr:ParA family partition ATPase [Novosphingobium marinum]NYH97141.1 chromosome partitioning protein [Novosphingobium marinum]GGC43835.1 peptide transporter [Novosphingobium marinum]